VEHGVGDRGRHAHQAELAQALRPKPSMCLDLWPSGARPCQTPHRFADLLRRGVAARSTAAVEMARTNLSPLEIHTFGSQPYYHWTYV
jgi:hypothetical protein